MDDIKDVTVHPCGESKYITPLRIHYTQNGLQKTWDATKVHDSVAILIYNKIRDVFVFVSQFRPAVYLNKSEECNIGGNVSIDTEKHPGSLGVTFELCAGIVDKDISVKNIAREEILEECGYDVPLDKIEKITSFRSGVGTTGAKQVMYYAEVTDDMKVSQGGGSAAEGEFIELKEIPRKDIMEFVFNEDICKPVGVMFAVMWFDKNKFTCAQN